MGLVMTDKGGKDFEILEAGTHAAVCTMLVDVGPQETAWGYKNKVKLRFEVPAERTSWTDKDGKEQEGPMVIWATYTASLSKKANLRTDLEGWRGRPFTETELMGFHLKAVLGQPCMISVVHREKDGKTYANIVSISRMPKGMPTPAAEGELIAFDFDLHTQADFDKLPEWLQKQVQTGKENLEKQRAATAERAASGPAGTQAPDFVEDDIPF